MKMTLSEAIKVLRKHNETGASVLRITKGQALEKELLSQLLDACEQLLSEKAEYNRILKEAVNDLRWLTKYHDPCELCGLRSEDADCPVDLDNGIDCDDIYKWRLEAEALKLIGDDK